MDKIYLLSNNTYPTVGIKVFTLVYLLIFKKNIPHLEYVYILNLIYTLFKHSRKNTLMFFGVVMMRLIFDIMTAPNTYTHDMGREWVSHTVWAFDLFLLFESIGK